MDSQDESRSISPHHDLSTKQEDVRVLDETTANVGAGGAAALAQQVVSNAENNTQLEDSERISMEKSSEKEPSLVEGKPNATEDSSTIGHNGKNYPEAKSDFVDSEESASEEISPKKSQPRAKLRRTSSSLPLRLVSLPKVNCRERIILCVDHADEMFSNKFTSHSSNNDSVFSTLISAISQFVNTKSYLNKNNQFSLILLNDGAQFITDLNRNPEELMMMLNDIASMAGTVVNKQTDIDKIFDLSLMFDLILDHSGLRDSPKQFIRTTPPFAVRVVFVYGRSDTRLVFSSMRKSFNALIKYPQFFLDCVYIHKPLHENSFVESIFSSICDLDVGGSSHIYEVGTDSNKACLFNTFSKLLAHPLQRPKQSENHIEYELKQEHFE